MSERNSTSTLLCVLSFFVPLCGLVLYFTKKKWEPEAANAYGKWALIGFGVTIFLRLLL